MSAKRLLLVIDEMEVGGSQRQVVHLLTGLDQSRWLPELVYFRNRSFLVDMLEQAGVRIHHIPKRWRIDPWFFLRLARLLRRGNYDAVHAFSLTAEFWSLLALKLQRRAPPLIASVRGLYLQQSARFWAIKRLILARCAGVISNSSAGADVASRQGHRQRQDFDVIGNGVSLPPPCTRHEREALRARVGAPEGRVFALYVGRMVEAKNLECLLDAMAALPADQRPWLALAGDGPLRARLLAHANAGGVMQDVTFLGERPDATSLMQAADFLVLPSREEGLSNSLLEAMAAGCPVIASTVGGNPELVLNEQTGLLFPNDDRAALAHCMNRLTSEPALRRHLSHQARVRAERQFSIPALVTATVAVYERCMGESAQTRQRACGNDSAPHPTESDTA